MTIIFNNNYSKSIFRILLITALIAFFLSIVIAQTINQEIKKIIQQQQYQQKQQQQQMLFTSISVPMTPSLSLSVNTNFCYSSNCLNCTNPLTCQKCSSSTQQNCCSPNCLNCSPLDNTSCLQCQSGYYQDSQNPSICVQKNSCSNNSACTSCNNFYQNTSQPISICSSCQSGLYLNIIINTCLVCSIDNCVECSPTGFSCIKCLQNGFVYVQGQCLNASVNNVSVNCTLNQYYSSISLCQNCNQSLANCALCGIIANGYQYQNQSNNLQCQQCSSGFYLKNGVCILCPPECQTCVDNYGCIQCDTGYSNPIVYSGKCLPCQQNCLECPNSNNMCTNCTSGWAASTNGSCFQCGSNSKTQYCSKCYGNMTCFQCNINYSPNSQGICRRQGYFGLPVWAVCLIGIAVLLTAAALLTLLLWFIHKKQKQNNIMSMVQENGGSVVQQYTRIQQD